MVLSNRKLIVLIIAFAILLIPLIAMQFTNQVNWSLFDFAIACTLLIGTGLIIEYALRKLTKSKYRVLVIVSIVLFFLLIWAELAVGVFNSPIAGN